MSWPKGGGIAIARPTRVLVFGKKSELKLVSHTAVHLPDDKAGHVDATAEAASHETWRMQTTNQHDVQA